jgi:hypothetical protein
MRGYYKVVMRSYEYGREEFHYDTLQEAKEGRKRLKQSAKEQKDGIDRDFQILKLKSMAK